MAAVAPALQCSHDRTRVGVRQPVGVNTAWLCVCVCVCVCFCVCVCVCGCLIHHCHSVCIQRLHIRQPKCFLGNGTNGKTTSCDHKLCNSIMHSFSLTKDDSFLRKI